jgi:asparagine synthase (glutamine-hydrolysing)
MCGICGVYGTGAAADSQPLAPRVARMTAALAHRGPDDEGVWAEPGGRVSLGNRRLAIIDRSAAGHQPMVDASGRVALTFNGMIYNFQDLRRDLAGAGYPFRGHSDTEVILALYLRDGAEMVRSLRGMFALALWDGRSQTLLLARDRFGIKPLYYTEVAGGWVFASEIRALRVSGLAPAEVNPTALAAFLRLGSVPGPMTAFEGVCELPPAAMLTIDGAGRGALRRYWEIPGPGAVARSEDEAVSELRARFADSVGRHLISDVPFGVFLSGGVDSGAIVATMRQAGHQRIRTCSITLPEWGRDEGPDAARLAARYGTEHTAYEVRGAAVAEELDHVIAAMDQPTIDGLNTYYVSRVTRESGTVVALSGLGGDELFCGYASFHQAPRVLAWQHVAARLGPARPALVAALAALPSAPPAKVREGLMGEATMQSAYLAVRGLFSRGEIGDLLRSGALRDTALGLDAAAALGAFAPALPDDPVAATAMLELRGYMHNQLLRDTDVMSMAHSLEVRVPFLDHPLVEFASSLPSTLRANGHPPKWLLLKALGDRLPAEAGQAKRGFTFPMAEWLRGPLRPRVDEALEAGAALFRPDAVRALRVRVENGRAHWSRLWAIVVLSLWLRRAGRIAGLA